MTAQIAHQRARRKGYKPQKPPVICAWCKARQRRGDTWGPLKTRFDSTQVSHGICPDCFAHELQRLKRTW